MHPTIGAFAGVDRPGHDDQPAALLSDPFFQQLDLAGLQQFPIGVEGHDAIVIEHFPPRGGEVVENLLRLLRHAGLARLQQHVDRRVAIAVKLVAEELVFPHRPVGQQQDVGLAIDDFDVGLADVVGRVGVALGRFDLQAQGAAAGGAGHEIELHRQHFAVAAEGDLLAWRSPRRRPPLSSRECCPRAATALAP